MYNTICNYISTVVFVSPRDPLWLTTISHIHTRHVISVISVQYKCAFLDNSCQLGMHTYLKSQNVRATVSTAEKSREIKNNC